MTTTAVANQKGGVAKTTSTHALGMAMAELGRKVLLVDLDPQASLTWACGLDPDALEISVHDVLLKRAKASDAIVELDPPPPPPDPLDATHRGDGERDDEPAEDGRAKAKGKRKGKGGSPSKEAPAPPTGSIHLLPSTIDLAGAELHLLTKTGREYVLRKALGKVTGLYDEILVDCPPSLGILTINGLTAADQVLVPLQCESLSQRGVGQLLDTIDDVRDYTNEGLRVRGAIATMFDGRTKLANQVVEHVATDYGIEVLQPYVPKSVKVAEAPGHGRSILAHAPRSRPAEAYRALAAQLVDDRATKGSTS